MLRPNSNWQWYFDTEQGKLAITLDDDLHFVTPYTQKCMSSAVVEKLAFSLDDMEYYLQLGEALEQCEVNLSGPQMTQIALNATAVMRFHKPLAPKSWYFQRQPSFGHHHRLGMLHTEQEQKLVVMIEKEGDSVICMLLNSEMQLDSCKSLKQFEVIKVMQDRISPCFFQQPLRKSA